jgi:GYF domain 2
MAELWELQAQGRLRDDVLVWQPGMSSWRPLATVVPPRPIATPPELSSPPHFPRPTFGVSRPSKMQTPHRHPNESFLPKA